MDDFLFKTLQRVARFYDDRKVGDIGPLGFRRSTDLKKLTGCLDRLLDERIIDPAETRFMDLGCADGRVNVFLSYLVKKSVGIELDDWTLEEYAPLRSELDGVLHREGRMSLPENISLFHGDSMNRAVHEQVARESGVEFEDFDLFYTYLIMHEEFAELIAEKAKTGSVFMVYGVHKILPRYPGLLHLENLSPMEGVLGVYRKI